MVKLSFIYLLIGLILGQFTLGQTISIATPDLSSLFLQLNYEQKENNVRLYWQVTNQTKTYIKNFEIYRNDELIKTTYNNEYKDEDLQNSIYKYYVKAIFSNNLSLKSNEIYVTVSQSQQPQQLEQPTILKTATTTTITKIQQIQQQQTPPQTPQSPQSPLQVEQLEQLRLYQQQPTQQKIQQFQQPQLQSQQQTQQFEQLQPPSITPIEEKIKINIKTLLPSGDFIPKAKVFISTEKEGLKEIELDNEGGALIELLPGQKVMINGVKEIDNKLYKSLNLNLELGKEEKNINLYLEPYKELPKPVELEIKTDKENKISLEDSTEVKIPAQVIEKEKIKIEIEPVISVPPVTNVSIIGNVYDVNIFDVQNNPIKQLNKEIEIRIPYDENELKDKGLTKDSIAIGYYDEISKNWIPLQKFVIDKVNNIVIGYVQHLTKFAIIAFADRTPPKPPANIKIRLIAGNKVKITWINPKEDFKYVRIYRSLDKDQWGSLYFDNVTSTEIIDDNIQRGQTYYYLVKSIDYAGNESLNSEPISIKIPTFKFVRHLKKGMSGNDVRILQEILIQEGVYPEKIVSGYFGDLTYQAVIKFQEKYRDEILRPWKFDKGTGFVGPKTIEKLNQIVTK